MRRGGRVKPKFLQRGGGVGNPITEVSLEARPGQFVYQQTGEPYVGLYHRHQNGTLMIGEGRMGVVHDIKSNEVIVPSGMRGMGNGRMTPMSREMSSYQRGGSLSKSSYKENIDMYHPSRQNASPANSNLGSRKVSISQGVGKLAPNGAILHGPIPSTGRHYYWDQNGDLHMAPNSAPEDEVEWEWIISHM